MASAGPSTSKANRRSLDAEVNLVPFIDLLSMCICFLLMTAVWMEIGSVNVKQVVGTDAPNPQTPTYELEMKFINTTAVEMNIRHPDKSMEKSTVKSDSIEQLMVDLKASVKSFTARFPADSSGNNKAAVAAAVSVAKVTTQTGVSYGEMVAAMDTLRDQGIINLGVTPVKE